jgi:tRNA (cmo5U34)-methyltransferase
VNPGEADGTDITFTHPGRSRFPATGLDVAEQFGTGAWQFTPEVAAVFPEHVRASVPFYDVIQALIAELSDWLVPAGGLVADLGAATGTTAALIAERHPARSIRFALYDESAAMLDRARIAAAQMTGNHRVETHLTRIQAPLKHDQADLTLALFTLQFLPRLDRLSVLRMARSCAAETGALIIADKTRPHDARWSEIANDVSHDWKAEHGISDTAIRAKARALRGVLVPYPLDDMLRMITVCGWRSPEVLFRWHSWVVIGAFASGDGPP